MKQTTEELKQIITSAPEGATYYLINQYNFTEAYFKLTKDLDVLVKGIDGWEEVDFSIELNGNFEARYLDDIREIVELREGMAELEANQAKRDLEQQAKALDNFNIPELSYTAFHNIGDALIEQAKQLRKQAQEQDNATNY
jgi:hypothetical protein